MRSAQSLCLLTRDGQGHRREYYLCDASSKQTDNIFFWKECCTQSVECKNAVSDLSRAVPLRGCCASSPTRPAAEGQGREGKGAHTHVRALLCACVCVCVHAHTRVTERPLFPWWVPCVFPLMVTKPGNSSFFLYRSPGIVPWTFFQLSTFTYRKSAQRLQTVFVLGSFALVSGVLFFFFKRLIKGKIQNTGNFALKTGV